MSVTTKSGRKGRQTVSSEVSELKDTISLLTSAVVDLKRHQPGNVSVDDISSKLSAISPPIIKKSSLSATTHVDKTDKTDSALDEQAVRIAELEAKYQELQDQFNTLHTQTSVFMGLCNKHTKDIAELRETLMKTDTDNVAKIQQIREVLMATK